MLHDDLEYRRLIPCRIVYAYRNKNYLIVKGKDVFPHFLKSCALREESGSKNGKMWSTQQPLNILATLGGRIIL